MEAENFSQGSKFNKEEVFDYEEEVKLEDYTPDALGYIKAMHNISRAILLGAVASLPQYSIKRYSLYKLLSNLPNAPLNELVDGLKVEKGELSVDSNKGFPDLTRKICSSSNFIYDMNIFNRFGFIEEFLGDNERSVYIKKDEKKSDLLLATSGALLNFVLKYPELSLDKLFKNADNEVGSTDILIYKLRLFKLLGTTYESGNRSPLSVSYIAQFIGMQYDNIKVHIRDFSKIGILQYDTSSSLYRFEKNDDIDSLPLLENYSRDLLKVIKQLSLTDKFKYYSAKEIESVFYCTYPGYVEKNLYIVKKLIELFKQGLIEKVDSHGISISEVQYEALKKLLYIIDGTIRPTPQFISQGKQYAQDIFNSTDQVNRLLDIQDISSFSKIKFSSKDELDVLLRNFFSGLSYLYPDSEIIAKIEHFLKISYKKEYAVTYIRDRYKDFKKGMKERKDEVNAAKIRSVNRLYSWLEEILKGGSALLVFDLEDNGKTFKSPRIVALAREFKGGFTNLLEALSKNPNIDVENIKRILEEVDLGKRAILFKKIQERGKSRVLMFVQGKRFIYKEKIQTDAIYFPLFKQLCKQILSDAYNKLGINLPVDTEDIFNTLLKRAEQSYKDK